MNQIFLKDNLLQLNVKKAPLAIRLVLFPVTFLFFLLPLFSLISILLTKQLGISSIIFVLIFMLSGFYLLRFTLWNTYGAELIMIDQLTLTYQADYGWFKSQKQEINLDNIAYSIVPHHSAENEGVLMVNNGNSTIVSVIPLPKVVLEQLISNLKTIKS